MKKLLCIFSSLSDSIALEAVPRARLVHDLALYGAVQRIALSGNSSAVHDIELRLLKRRRYFIFNDFDSRPVSYDLIAGFNAFDPAHIHTHRRVELQRAASGSDLRIAEHDPHLFSQLIDKNDGNF